MQGVPKRLRISEDEVLLLQAATSPQSDRAALRLALWVRQRQCVFDQLSLERKHCRKCTRALPNPNACGYQRLRFSLSRHEPPWRAASTTPASAIYFCITPSLVSCSYWLKARLLSPFAHC